jgi:protein-S-isoprenylcysteine O-methyltransferase Ste14
MQSAVGLVILIVVVTPSWAYVIKQEENFLLSKLGNDYLTYIGKTKKLIPFVY